jgi:ribose transport system permease protein
VVNVLIFVFMSIAKPSTFFDGANFEAILINMACDLLLACGMTIVLILAGVDLSVGAVVAFTSVIAALLMKSGMPAVLAVVIALIVSVVLGWLNGLLVGVGKLAPFVATLGTQTILRGSCYVITLGYQVTGLPKGFLELGQGSLLGLSNIIWISIIMTVILGVLLTRLKIFKQVYLVGTSQSAAFMSGIPSNRIISFGYAVSGFFAGLTGIILTSRYAMGFAGFFVGSEMRAIAAAVIGGAVMLGAIWFEEYIAIAFLNGYVHRTCGVPTCQSHMTIHGYSLVSTGGHLHTGISKMGAIMMAGQGATVTRYLYQYA